MSSSTSMLSKTQLKEIRDAFDIFDKDGSGSISIREMKQLFRALEIQASDEEIQKLMKQMDFDGDGEISFEEFVMIMGAQFCRTYTREEIKATFDFFDHDGNGYISCSELNKAFLKLGKKFSEDEVAKMIRAVDTDKNGMISIDEFARLLN